MTPRRESDEGPRLAVDVCVDCTIAMHEQNMIDSMGGDERDGSRKEKVYYGPTADESRILLPLS